MNRISAYLFLFVFLTGGTSFAQTARSLFRITDSLQVAEIVSGSSGQSLDVGHGGPAVENSHMALRILLDGNGAVDVYTKTGRGMELLEYFWQPSVAQIDTLYAGYDCYETGETLGLGGVALWDGDGVVPLSATEGRILRAGETKKGSFVEVVSCGVEYMGMKVDVSVRIDVFDKSRIACISASELSGRKVRFVTGVNWHEGQQVNLGEGYVSVWGRHPVEVHGGPVPVGAGMFYSAKDFPTVEKIDDMVRIISRPAERVKTEVVAASTREAELNSARRFVNFMSK